MTCLARSMYLVCSCVRVYIATRNHVNVIIIMDKLTNRVVRDLTTL